jgi:F0F1-type ATP synthase assembly protein I
VGSGDDRQKVTRSLALASMVTQIGCVTLVIVVGGLVLGLWLDNQLDTRPLFTVLLLLGTIPVSVFALVRIAVSAAAQLSPSPSKVAKDEPSDQD